MLAPGAMVSLGLSLDDVSVGGEKNPCRVDTAKQSGCLGSKRPPHREAYPFAGVGRSQENQAWRALGVWLVSP